MPVIANEVHHRECKIVDHIDRGDVGIELDRIEQDGLALDQYDVGQMQVTMTASHTPLFAPPLQQSVNPRKRRQRRLPEVIDIAGGKVARGLERRCVAFDDRRDRCDPSLSRCSRGDRMRSRNCVRDGRNEGGIQRAGLGQMVDGLTLVEAHHLNGEFDRCAVAIDGKRSIVALRDRNHTAVDFWRELAIYSDLFIAGGLALLQRRIIQIWKPD